MLGLVCVFILVLLFCFMFVVRKFIHTYKDRRLGSERSETDFQHWNKSSSLNFLTRSYSCQAMISIRHHFKPLFDTRVRFPSPAPLIIHDLQSSAEKVV